MNISEMGMFKMFDALVAWQGDPNLHELTCRNDGGNCSDAKLVPKIAYISDVVNISGQEGYEIVLECPQCGSKQKKVPEHIYQWYIDTHLNHNIPLGQVVDVELTEGYGADAIFIGKDFDFQGRYGKPSEGVEGDQEICLNFIGRLRALVVGYARDRDGTPLYCLSNIRVKYNCDHLPDGIKSRMEETIRYKKWSEYLKTGFSEEDLKIVEGQFVPLLYNSIFEYENIILF